MNRNLGLLALTGVLTLASCSTGPTTPPVVTPPPTTETPVTTGSVTIVKPDAVTAVVRNEAGTVVAPSTYGALAPGNYSVTFSREGYVSQTATFTIVARQNTQVTAPNLVQNPTTTPNRGVYYINAAGNLVAIPAADLRNPDRFVFSAWLEDLTGGVAVANNAITGTPTTAEQDETAPSRSQNLASAYVGYRAADGTVFPVAGATVRWNITGAASGNGANTPVIFGGADDGSNDTNFGGGVTPPASLLQPLAISAGGKQADTITNSAVLANTPFPSTTGANPLFNRTGVTSPNINGYTWTTLFAAADRADAQVVAVASIGDLEIGKQVLAKTFAPQPNVVITKTVIADSDGNNDATAPLPGGTVTLRITVRNTGAGAATDVRIQDRLFSGDAAAYNIVALPAGTTAQQGNDGFDATIANLAPGAEQNFDFQVTATAAGVYCDRATLVEFRNVDFGLTTSGASAEACAIFVAPQVNVFKTFVDANGAELGSNVTVNPNTPARLRIRVTNNGGAAANVTSLIDNLVRVNGTAVTTENPNYSITLPTQPAGATANARDGFDYRTAFTLAPGATQDFFFTAQANADGTYCDAATVTSNGGNPTSSEACLTVVTPALNITKTNNVDSVRPGENYTSTITVRNTGTGTATNVNISDILGRQINTNNYVTYASSSFSISGGAATAGFFNPANQTAYAGSSATSTINIPAGGSVVFTVTSTVPAAAQPGTYCDFATFTSSNAGTQTTSACVQVRVFAALQTQLTDTIDPIVANGGANADGRVNYTSVLSNEVASNEAVRNSVVTYAFGAAALGGADGQFNNPTATNVFFDPTPQRDAATGAVISRQDNATAVRLVQGTDYTITNNAGGEQTLNISRQLPAGGVFFVVHEGVSAPTGLAPRQYFTSYVWNTVGVLSNAQYQGRADEPTTVR